MYPSSALILLRAVFTPHCMTRQPGHGGQGRGGTRHGGPRGQRPVSASSVHWRPSGERYHCAGLASADTAT